MGIGVGVLLLVLGLIVLTRAIHLPASWEAHISHHSLGWILVVAGVVALLLGLLESRGRRRRVDTVVTRDDDVTTY